MKQTILITPENSSEPVRSFIRIWKTKKNYPQTNELTLGQVIELIMATSYTFYKEDSDTRFFNNLLMNEESNIAWDGEELIDILFFQATQNIKKRLASARTFNSEIEVDPV